MAVTTKLINGSAIILVGLGVAAYGYVTAPEPSSAVKTTEPVPVTTSTTTAAEISTPTVVVKAPRTTVQARSSAGSSTSTTYPKTMPEWIREAQRNIPDATTTSVFTAENEGMGEAEAVSTATEKSPLVAR